MISKRIATGCVAASLAITPINPALAGNDAIVGGIIGGIVGGVIVNEANKKKRTTTTVRRSTSSAQRELNRETQVALNYFGFPVGTPDGSIGPRSRAAIREYQATLGYPVTGQLTEYERNLLVGSYHRGVAGGSYTMQQAAANPMGMRGLIVTWRDEANGIVQPSQNAAMPVMPVPQQTEPVTEAVTVAPAPEPASPGLPSFFGTNSVQASLASHCNKIGLMTSTNGGYTTVASMTDPVQAMGEQFCLVRSYAIAQGEDLASRLPGVTPQDIASQCEGFGPAMKEQITSVSLKPAGEVMSDVRKFALSSGMAPAQLSATAKICLSVGYRDDNMDVAVASGLILAALGEGAYGELLGHHLSQGFGASQRSDLAFDWYEMALTSAEQTGVAVFAPGQPERMQLVRKAAYTMAGRADQAAVPETLPAALPSFSLPAAPEASVETVAITTESAPADTTEQAAMISSDQVSALPLAARLPFLLFSN
ncbi:MAG: peptidoglycan-binding protein [Paracoccaceae bacterium]|nr:peptidoglycan-binding protein [Paracoccaceae bacterium]